MASEVDNLIRELKRRHSEGIEVIHTNNGHIKVRRRGKLIATLSVSPSDHRSLKNAYRNLRAAGIVVHNRRPPKKKAKL